MAPRRSAEVIEEPQLGGLKFNEPLSWRAGKPIATSELLKRLDTLSIELRDMEQEDTDKDSLTHVAKELAGQNLINHKDKGVRAFTACCLVDILRICAPDAPFTATMLKEIFTLFITSILPALSDPSNAYNTQHKYVLVSLAEVKSVVLLTDIPNSEALLHHLFTTFFDIISGSSKASTGEQIAKDVEYHMTQILVTMVDEAHSLASHIVDVIIAQFLRASGPGGGKGKAEAVDDKQSTFTLKELPAAYNMARTICNSCPEKMARYISIYFNEVIMEVSTAPGATKSNGHRRASDAADSDEDEPAGPTEADLRELSKAHRLLRELWRASPPVLQNVIPQLEAELSAENVQLRLLATETLGDIISGIGAAGPPPPPVMDPAAYPPAKLDDYQPPSSSNILTTPVSPQSFTQTYPSVYHNFLGRKNDKSLIIRSGWTTAVGRILVTSAGGIGLSREDQSSLVKGLAEKLNDADDKVRLAAVKAIAGFSFFDIMDKLALNGGVNTDGSVLWSLADRARDRKHAVRVDAMTTLSRIWGVAAGEIAAGNEAVIAALGRIPSKIFNAYYTNDLDLNVLLDHVMFEQLIPLAYPPTAKGKGSKAANGNAQANQEEGNGPFDADKIRTERILLVVRSLDAKSKKAFFALQARQSTYSNVLLAFLKRCEEYNGGVTDGNAKEIKMKLDTVIKWLAGLLPDPLRITHDLQKYAKLHDRRSYQLLRFAVASESDFKTVNNGIKEFSKRMRDSKEAPAGLLETLLPIIYRSASLIYNRSHLPAIMQYSRSDENGLGATAHEVNREISERMPQVFQSNVKELCKTLQDDAPSSTKSNDLGSVETLRACAEFAKTRPGDLPRDRKFIQALLSYAVYGTPAKAAKYAVRILMGVSDKKEMHAKDLLDKTVNNWSYGSSNFLTKLATISQLSLEDPHITDEYNDEILDITIQKTLLKVQTPVKDTDRGWQPDLELDEECQAKCWALKILVNRLKTVEDPETAKTLADPVYKLLNALIVKEGELSKKGNTPRHHKSRLRLRAAQLMLKLCRSKLFDDLLTPAEFNQLAIVAQDKHANVRRGFIEKLQKYLVKNQLPSRYYTIVFLTAFEPELDFKNSIVTWIRSRSKAFNERKTHAMESIFPRLLSLLAHHPDYSDIPKELVDHARYILYYLTTVSSEDNLALIYKYAERVKQTRDAIDVDQSEHLYVLSDLAQSVIRAWEQKKGWNMQTWPAKVGLPIGLFAPLPSHEVAQEIAEKQYLPDEIEESLEKLVRQVERRKKRKIGEDNEDDDAHSSIKKQKAEPKVRRTSAAKKERPVKEKTAAKTRKRRDSDDDEMDISKPAPSSVNRRVSNRGVSARKSYADRDDSEDDKEMWDGVAEWEYEGSAKGNGNREAESAAEESDNKSEAEAEAESEPEVEAEAEEEEAEPKEPTPEPEEEEEEVVEATPPPQPKKRGRPQKKAPAPAPAPAKEPTPEPEEEEEEEEVEATPPPPKKRGRPTKKAAAPAPAAAKITKPKAKAALVVGKGKARTSLERPKPKGKAKPKDVFDMDMDDSD